MNFWNGACPALQEWEQAWTKAMPNPSSGTPRRLGGSCWGSTGPGRGWTGDIPFFAEGEGWQRRSHIYQSPFCYIDYCQARTVALQFWTLSQRDQKAAWEKYMAYARQGGSRAFTELLSSAGLDSPFEENTLREVCAAAKDWLDGYDLTGIR